MKLKLFALTIICMILLMGSISAAEWDNKLTYSENDMKVDLVNWFGWGTNYGSAELKSHSNVNEIKPVKIGDSVLMWYATNFSNLYENGIGDIEIKDMNTGKIIQRDYEFVYWGTETYEVPNYVCDSKIQVMEDQCVESGTKNEIIEKWLPYNSRDIPEGEITIGLKMNMGIDETFDLVWSFGGKELEKHAVVSSGAVKTTDGDFTVLTFSNNGTFNTTADINVSVLVVAGGAGGSGGGGGAGEVLNDSVFLVSAGNYNVTVGDGGDGRRANGAGTAAGNNGGNSLFISFTARGGGGGGRAIAASSGDGLDGGSGGGGGQTGSGVNTGGTGDQGDGGDSLASGVFPAGGGGGVLADGTDGTGSRGLGGVGIAISINGTNITYGTGGDGAVNADAVNRTAEIDGTGDGGDGTSNTRWGGDGGDGVVIIRFIDPLPTVLLISPINNFNTSNPSITFNGTISVAVPDNVTLFIDDVGNETNSTGILDHYQFTKIISEGVHTWNYQACAVNSCSNGTERTFTISAAQTENYNFNATAFETSTQTIIVNISTNGTAPLNAGLIYNGTFFPSATITNTVNDFYNISRSIPIPTSIGNKSFNFNFTIESSIISTDSQNQTINSINLTLCGASPQNVTYINISFKNETINQENLNATIVSTWVYSLSSVGTINKTLSFSNSSENTGYDFCFNPQNRTVNIDLLMNYNNAQSQQRSFSLITALTNLTTSQVLYLLPTSLGLFSPFQVVDNIGNPISSVKGLITRILNSQTITISSAFTDDSGFVSYFLNPEATYTGAFSKTGFSTETFSFTPTSDTRTVILGGGIGIVGNGTSILTNTTYTITPSNRTLTNGTDFTFGFNVLSSQTITFISMNITSNGTSYLFVSNAGQGLISGIVNTGENSSFTGYFVIQTADETFSLASIWIIDQTFIGDYSLFRQMVLFNDYEFSNFIRLLIVLILMIGIMIFVNNIGISDDSESKIAIALLLVWAFSIVGWLDTGIISSSGSSNIQNLAQFSNQFGIAILSTGAGAYFILRRVFT